MNMATYCVLGYGGMGKIIVKDLFETTGKKDTIIVAGRNLHAARDVARRFRSSRVTARYADVTKHETLVPAFRSVDVVIHAVHHEYNVAVMKACLAAGCHYTDLGGLYHWVRPQLKLNNDFKKKKLTAIISMGAAPGITDVMARYAADLLETVETVDIRVGSMDKTRVIRPSPFSSSYSIDTILQECSYPSAVLAQGKIKFVEPMSGRVPYQFPLPVGVRKPMYTIHSELATIPRALRSKGIRNCSFKIAFDDDFVVKVGFLKALGFLSEKPVRVNGHPISPKKMLLALLKRLPAPVYGKENAYEIIRVVAHGKKNNQNNQQKTITMDCHTTGMPLWNIGVDIDTGAPASIGAQMIACGTIAQSGVFVAGDAVPPELFFRELKKRNMRVYHNNRLIN